jgi:hypothetical protein
MAEELDGQDDRQQRHPPPVWQLGPGNPPPTSRGTRTMPRGLFIESFLHFLKSIYSLYQQRKHFERHVTMQPTQQGTQPPNDVAHRPPSFTSTTTSGRSQTTRIHHSTKRECRAGSKSQQNGLNATQNPTNRVITKTGLGHGRRTTEGLGREKRVMREQGVEDRCEVR